MTKILIAAALVLLVFSAWASWRLWGGKMPGLGFDKYAEYSDDELSLAALRALTVPHVSTIWPTQPSIDGAKDWCIRTRRWLDEQPDMTPRLRRAYMRWINFTEREIGGAEHEMRTKSKHLEHEAWRAKQSREDERISTIELPRPR